MNIQDASQPKRRRSRQERLEEQLQDVLERDDVPVFFPGRRARSAQSLPGSELDIQIAKEIQSRVTRTRRKPVHIRHEPHEASAYLIRLEGVAAKPLQEVREPFHRSMHRWQTPMLDGVDVNAVLVHAADLWVDAIDPEYIASQFTPGDPVEALRESQRGLWTRIRRPFIRWAPSAGMVPPSSERRARPASNAAYGAIETPSPQAPLETPDSVPSSIARDMEIEAMPLEAQTGSPKPSSWRRWRERIGERWAMIREREQETVRDVEETWEAPYVQASVRPGRVIIAFLGLLCMVAMPAGAVSWSRSLTQSLESTKSAAAGLAIGAPEGLNALASWSDQLAKLEGLTKSLERTHGLAFALAQVVPSTRSAAKTTQALLTAAQEGAEAARLVSLGIARLSDGDVSTPDERLVRLQKYLQEAQPHLMRLYAAAHLIHPETLPNELRGRVTEVQTTLFALEPVLASADRLVSLLLGMVGHDQARTYLVVFQNTGELRPSGGFMGSYAEATLDRGALRKLHVPGGGPYDLRSQLRARWRPPEPLTLVGPRWEFQDANWSPDFAQTAATIETFWSKAGQPSVDGIIAINSTILPKLLTLTGPIDMPAYGKRVTAENVVFETQKAVELEYDRAANTPKAFVGDLNKEVITRLQALGPDKWSDIMTMLAGSLETKEIQLWFARPEEQEAARTFGWTGEWAPSEAFASLGIVGANIAGQKSDAVIKEDVHQLVTIDERGSIQERMLLAREHRGVAGQMFQGANNVQYLRVYTPQGTRFTDAEGFEVPDASLFESPTEKEELFPGAVTSVRRELPNNEWIDVSEENGRSVAGGWIQLRPGMSRETAFSYQLPHSTEDMAQALLDGTGEESVSDAYVLRLHSQSGAPRGHHVRIMYPMSWAVIRLSPGMKQVKPGVIEWERPALDRDQILVALFSRYVSSNTTKTSN